MVIKDKVAAAVYVDAVERRRREVRSGRRSSCSSSRPACSSTRWPSARRSPRRASATMRPAHAGVRRRRAPVRIRRGAAPPRPLPRRAPAAAPRPRAARTAASATAVPTAHRCRTVAINAAQLREMMAAQRPSFNVPSAEDFGVGGAHRHRRHSAPHRCRRSPGSRLRRQRPRPACPRRRTRRRRRHERRRAPIDAVHPAGRPRPRRRARRRRRPKTRRSTTKPAASPACSSPRSSSTTSRKSTQGRKNNDLYERLKEDIDRSRQMYDERIADDVRKIVELLLRRAGADPRRRQSGRAGPLTPQP